MKHLLQLAGPCLSLALFSVSAHAADKEVASGATPPPAGATIRDEIGTAADALFGEWNGTLRGTDTPCQLNVSDYYAGYSGDTSANPIKTRRLIFTVSAPSLEEGGSLMLTDVEQFMSQKDRGTILIDYSQSADGLGAILRQYSKIKLSLKNGMPRAAVAEDGDIRFGVIIEKRVDLNCTNLQR